MARYEQGVTFLTKPVKLGRDSTMMAASTLQQATTMENKTNKGSRGNSKSESSQAAEADNVDKIRDILFGNQMREMDQRFASLEKNLARDLDKLRSDNNLQIESLKDYFESEVEIINSKLAAEEKARIEGDDELEDQLKQQVKLIDKKLADLGKQLDKHAREINQKMLKQSQDFSNELNNQINEARERMDSHRQELGAAKVDKLTLSEILNNLALQVTGGETK